MTSPRMASRLVLSLCATLPLSPALASAQSLAGLVRDASGGVLPGVVVEASGPALITRVRSAVTDGGGQYRIPDLPPGPYTVTFTLSGFATLVRDGVELTGGGVTSINADLRVGAVKETVTVTVETPVVDVQTTRQERVLAGDVVRALPASRNYGNYLAAVPAIQINVFNTGASPSNVFFTARGGRVTEGTIQIDGLNVGAVLFGAGTSGYFYDMSNSAEVQVSIGGGLGEAERGGPAFNIIPKTGGNAFRGFGFASHAGQWGQSSNIDDRLRALGFADLPALVKSWDDNFSLGGPITRDRFWFYGSTRTVGTHQEQLNQYANLNAGNPNAWTWQRDENQPVRFANRKYVSSMRLTYQATQKNRLGFYIDYSKDCQGSSYVKNGGQCRDPGDNWTASGPAIGPSVATTSPESGTIWDNRSKIMQASWSSPISSRVLLESAYSSFLTQFGDVRPAGVLTDFIPVIEQSTATGVPFGGYVYRGWNAAPSFDQQHATWRASVSYVTGGHNLKVGYQAAYMRSETLTQVGRQLSYVFNNAAPLLLLQRVGPTMVSDRVRYDALFVQDQWTRRRLTLQGALRYETARSWSPAGANGILERHEFGEALLFPRVEGVRGYHDITPRMGVAYDVFGNSKTALKFSAGEYLQGAFAGDVYTINNPAVTLVSIINRAWTDPNGNRIAECDLLNPTANGECGPLSNVNFGASVPTTTVNPRVLEGWGVRPRDWQLGAGIQQRLFPQTALEVSYNRRLWHNFFITDNRALGPSDFDTVTLSAPRDPRLPRGGGYPVAFLTRNANNVLGASDPYYTTTKDYGDVTYYWHGVDVNFSAKMRNGLVVQAGTSTGRGVRNTCEVTSQVPELLVSGNLWQRPESCAVTEPWLTTLRGLATYTVPKVDVLVSGIVRSQPNALPNMNSVATNGSSRNANFQMTPAQFLAATGRPMRAGLAAQFVDLLLPGELYGNRVSVVDVRVAKIVRYRRYRANIGLDLFNLFNSNTPTFYESVFDPATNGARWMQPTFVLLPRVARLNIQVDF